MAEISPWSLKTTSERISIQTWGCAKAGDAVAANSAARAATPARRLQIMSRSHVLPARGMMGQCGEKVKWGSARQAVLEPVRQIAQQLLVGLGTGRETGAQW